MSFFGRNRGNNHNVHPNNNRPPRMNRSPTPNSNNNLNSNNNRGPSRSPSPGAHANGYGNGVGNGAGGVLSVNTDVGQNAGTSGPGSAGGSATDSTAAASASGTTTGSGQINPLLLGPNGEKPLYLCSPFADAALVKGNFKTIVVLPKYTDIMEWVAVNIFDFYTNLNEFYGVITETCTQTTCPTMSGGPNLNYVWTHQGGKQVMLPAPTYIDYVMTSIQNLVDDENIFPTKSNQPFHPSFPATIRTVYRQLLRVFAHIYHAHYPHILHLRSEPHFNSLFAHFLAFGREYELLEVRDIKGDPGAPVGVGVLWERWKEKGILEG